MISTLLGLGVTLILLALLLGLAYVGFYALVWLVPVVILAGGAYTIYCVVKQTFFKEKDRN